MSRTTLGFIYSALCYLVLGVALGGLMALFPGLKSLKAVHAHLNLIGFVTFMIFGIAYHILPRFRGRPLHSERLAWWGLWLANIAFAGFALFSILEVYTEISPALRAAFAVLMALAFYLFVYNVGRTLIEKPKE